MFFPGRLEIVIPTGVSKQSCNASRRYILNLTKQKEKARHSAGLSPSHINSTPGTVQAQVLYF
jgi:hypothetical protein